MTRVSSAALAAVVGLESATLSVTIPQSSEISFYCKYHKSRGMAGALAASG